MVLAHVEPATHGDALSILVRLGPLLALAFVGICSLATARAGGPKTRQASFRRVGGIVLGAAGLLHLALVPEHLREGAAVGSFFLGAGVAQVALGALLWRRAGPRVVGAVLVLTGGLVALYAASRIWALPLGLEREEVDAIGLLTKSLELLGGGLAVAATRPWRMALHRQRAVAALTLGTALVARPLFDLGPRPLQLATVVLVALTATAIVGGRPPGGMATTLADAAVFGLLVRGDGLSPFLIGGVVLALFRQAQREGHRPFFAPVALAALAVLVLPGAGARLEILHVAHPGEPLAWLVGLALAAALLMVARDTGGLPAAVAFYATHLGLQGARLLTGRTSIEAIEVPGASLGLLLIAVVVLADPALTRGRARLMAGAGVLSGAADVLLRDLGVRYPALFAVAGAVVAAAAWDRLRPSARVLQPVR